MTRIHTRHDYVVTFRWPYQVIIDAEQVLFAVPWWGRPYLWLMNLFGVRLVTLDRQAAEKSRDEV